MASASAAFSTAPSITSFRHNHTILSPNTATANSKHDNVNLGLSSSSSSSSSTMKTSFLSKFNNNSSSECTSFATSSSSSLIPQQAIKHSFESTSPQIQTIHNVSLSIQKKIIEIKRDSEHDSRYLVVNMKPQVSAVVTPGIISDKITSKYKDEEDIKQDLQESRVYSSQILDENSNNSTKSMSSSSSSSNENSPKKKRRRAENERLMEDLLNIDSSLAANVSKLIKTVNTPDCLDIDDTDNGSMDKSWDGNSCDGTIKTKSSDGDGPALHLRPRRNIRPPPFSGYYSSGSSSPVYLGSPMKNQQRFRMNITQNLLNDTSKQLSKYLENNRLNNNQLTISNDIKTEIEDIETSLIENSSEQGKTFVRPIDRCVLRDVEVSVFATLITPKNLKMNNFYEYNYVSLKITNFKPIRLVELVDEDINQRIICPILELATVDVNDRFGVEYMKGIFDEPNISAASTTILTVFLLGSYAVKSENLISNGSIINIVKFRTSNQRTVPARNVKKRKLIGYKEYPFTIIVDSPNDSMNWMKTDMSMQNEEEKFLSLDDPFIELYNNSNSKTKDLSGWLPLVSYSDKWIPPKDPRELNRSLYIIQPCIPKFESSSRTVKITSA